MAISIVYYSHTRNNERLARYLADRLQCGLIRIAERRKRTSLGIVLDLLFRRRPRIEPIGKALEDYDHLVLVAPVWAGRIASPMRAFLQRDGWRLRTYSFITLCGYRHPGQKRRLTAELTRLTGRPPADVCELRVADLLPPEQQNSIRYVTPRRIESAELRAYDESIEDFLSASGLRELLEERACHC